VVSLASNQTISTVPTSIASPTFQSSEISGLGGWLIFVGFGLLISPLRLIEALVLIYKPYINGNLLDQIADPASVAYIPNFKILFFAEVLVNIFLIILSLYLIYLFFSKKKNFPKIYIFTTLFVVVYIPIDAYLLHIIAPNVNVLRDNNTKAFFQALISGVVWIPYMLKSKRVRNTFIED